MGNFFEGDSDAKEKYNSIVNRIRETAESFRKYNETVHEINIINAEFRSQDTSTPEGIEEAKKTLAEMEELIDTNLYNDLLDTVSNLQTDINFFLIEDFDLKLKNKYLKLKEKRFELLKKTDGVIKRYLNYFTMKDLQNLQKKGKMTNPKLKPIKFFDGHDDKFLKKINTKKFHPKSAYTEAKNMNDESNQQSEQTNNNGRNDGNIIKPKYIGGTTIGKRRKKIPERRDYQNQQDDDQDKEFKKKIKRASTDAKTGLNENIEKTVKKIAKKKKDGGKKTAKKKKKKSSKKVE